MSDKLIRKSEILNIPDNKKREIACEYTGLSLSEIDTIRKFSRNQRHCLYAILSAIDLSLCWDCGGKRAKKDNDQESC